MTRINLYNYRYHILYYRKLRVYLLLVTGIILALMINLLIFSYYELRILVQQQRNSFLIKNLAELNSQLKPINDFNTRVQVVNNKIQLIKQIEKKRDDMVAFFQELNQIVPSAMYFTSLSWQGNMVNFTGAAASPLYIAEFLIHLRDDKSVFSDPVLKSNATGDGNNYNFAVSAIIKKNLVAKTDQE